MPAMFGSRRHAPPVQPLTRETADPNAATAAASAFMRRDSNASLSSAAAAAALRARPMTPTNVAEVQSKRTHRRSPSMSTLASRDKVSRRELRRTPSVGSMIERTFRSPSPGLSPAPSDRNVPPVPIIPKVDHLLASEKTNGGQRKGTALQTQPFRTASEKMKDGQHGSWFGGATTARDPSSVRSSDSVMHASAVSLPEPRPGSVSPSINFSYPRARMQSPPPPSVDDRTLVYDANSRRMVPRGELVARSHSLREASDKPKKKHDIVKSGSHLSRGTVGRLQAPALETSQPLPADRELGPVVASEQPQEPIKKKKKKQQQQAEEVKPTISEQTVDRDAVNSADIVRPPLVKKPSVVAEEPELEEREGLEDEKTDLRAVAKPAAQGTKKVANGQARSTEMKKRGSVYQTRAPSASPARSARFAPATDQLVIRHEPPPRSVSPKKSAMKLSAPRSVSPSDDSSETSAGRGLSPQRQDDPALARKKGVRVSWDDRNTVVVGESAPPQEMEPPVIPSPQAKKPWHSIVTKYTRKGSVTLGEDETMGPRPALPLFGSVRDKKSRDLEERPLVRPSERTWSEPASAPSETTAVPGLGQSSDAAIGAAWIQDQASRNAANISKYREPLPVAVPSVEGDAKDADFAESSDDGLDTDVTMELDPVAETTPSLATERLETPEHENPTKVDPETRAEDGEAVPTISISHPSPGPQEPSENAFSNAKLELPGGFPDEEDVSNTVQSSKTPPTTMLEIAAPATPTPSAEPLNIATSPTMDDIEEEEADRCSVYSDAYEDLDEVDGDGFMSLDAVIESPAGGELAKKLQEQVLAQSRQNTHESLESPASAKQPPRPSGSSDDWENAKAYWKSLSTGQRRRLEIEALTDAGEDTDLESRRAVKDDGKQQATKDSTIAATQSIQLGTKRFDEASEDAAVRASVLAAKSRTPGNDVPKFRQSMRSEPPAPATQLTSEPPGGMRKSMRSGRPAPTTASGSAAERAPRKSRRAESDITVGAPAAGAGMRKSLRAGRTKGDDADELRPSLSQSGRPVSYQPPPAMKSPKAHKRNLSVEDLASRGSMGPSLRRRGSDDSVSSFTRSRASPGAGHGFRRSMRVSAQEPPSPIAARGSSRFSLRSLSPTGFRRASVTSLPGPPSSMSGGAGRMRQSLRGQSVDRGSGGSGTRLSPFKRSPGGKKGKKASRGSRFADSSDEDEGGPSLFSSRFADSSDDDDENVPRHSPKGNKGLPKSLRGSNASSNTAAASAMGVTPATREMPSSELPDSDDGMVLAKRGAATNGQAASLRRSRSGRGTLAPLPMATQGEEAPRPSSSRRGSFMSILRRKKDSSGKISRHVNESAARRDTKLERATEELAVMRSNSLHKRGPSWPLPGGADEGNEEQDGGSADKTRPSTAGDAPPKAGAFLVPRSTSQGVIGLGRAHDDDESLAEFPQQKKKKFGALRKMFGIHD